MRKEIFDKQRAALLTGFCEEVHRTAGTIQSVNTQENWQYIRQQLDYLAKLGEILEAIEPYEYEFWPEFLEYEGIDVLVEHLNLQEDGLFLFLRNYRRDEGPGVNQIERLSSVHVYEYLEKLYDKETLESLVH